MPVNVNVQERAQEENKINTIRLSALLICSLIMLSLLGCGGSGGGDNSSVAPQFLGNFSGTWHTDTQSGTVTMQITDNWPMADVEGQLSGDINQTFEHPTSFIDEDGKMQLSYHLAYTYATGPCHITDGHLTAQLAIMYNWMANGDTLVLDLYRQ